MIRKLRRLFLNCAALLAFAANALALSPDEWRFRQQLDVPAAGLIRIDIPPATLDAARPALEDLRLIDSAGQEVAFLIEQPAPQPAAQHRPRSFRASVEAGATVLAIETGLVAAQLLGAEKTIATLGPEAPIGKQPHRESDAQSRTGGVAFWIVLELVVAGLLIVLARMLPHPPNV